MEIVTKLLKFSRFSYSLAMGLIPIKELCERYDWSIDLFFVKIKCGLIKSHSDHHGYEFVDEDQAKAAFVTATNDFGVVARHLQWPLNRPTLHPLDTVTSARECFQYLRKFPEYRALSYHKILNLIKSDVIKADSHLVRHQKRYRCTRRSMRFDVDAYLAAKAASRMVKTPP
jgi:hypothetical protein